MLVFLVTSGLSLIFGLLDVLSFAQGAFLLIGAYVSYGLFIIGIGLVTMVGVFLLLNRTRIGIVIRGGVQDPEMVQALGINVRRVFTLVFVLGAALAALGLNLGEVYLRNETFTLDAHNSSGFQAGSVGEK